MLTSANIFTSVIAPYINFFLFLGILVYFSRKPLAALALSKKEAFDNGASEATQRLQKAQAEHKDTTTRLAQLDAEVHQMIENAKAEADAERARQEREGEEAVKRIMADADRVVASELLRAQTELRREVFHLVRSAVTTQVGEELTQSDQRQIVSRRVSELEDQYAGNRVS